ncbi:MAG: SCO family protein, partial [Casimicrobiaceae bacterium]
MRNVLIGIILVASLAACTTSQKDWHAKNITGLMPDLAITMTDDNGRAVNAGDYRGNIDLVFFGYSNCPDECPTTLARLAEAIAQMKT